MTDAVVGRAVLPSLIGERLFDVTLAVIVGLLTSPLTVVLAAVIAVADGTPVIHRATRVGRGGVGFTVYKFRTMDLGIGTRVTFQGDPRMTRLGGVLRRWKLDELPQLWNVIRGDMSLVGPRPEDPWYVEGYTPDQRRLLSVRPGLTSPATLAHLREEEILSRAQDPEQAYVDDILPTKLALDLAWLDTRSMRGDAGVLAATVRAMLSSK